ncbi:RNI-like protein [Xylariomycetidae sp. FL0641]|nr:RNI-like protein [Xylariomycetidae sp. FL0641]
MSNNNSQNQGRAGRSIRGPQSALTDFLASQNISAYQIQASVNQRRRQAAQAEQAEQAGDNTAASASAAAQREAQQKTQRKAITRIKRTKQYQERKHIAGDDSDAEELANFLRRKTAPLPGQQDHCALCDKRFTVTPYTRQGPDGGLLCNPCGRAEDAKDKDNQPAKKKRATGLPRGSTRRTAQSRILDGTQPTGAKPLVTLCIETLAKNVDLAQDLGDLPPMMVDRVARLLSKRRLINPSTLQLFLQPQNDTVNVYDAAKLQADDFVRIFQSVPSLKMLKLRNAIGFKDEVMNFLLSRNITLESIYLHGANLLSEKTWSKYLQKKGKHLQQLQVYYTDKHFGDDLVAKLANFCPSLNRLKICHNQQVSDTGVRKLGDLKKLEHLSLNLQHPTTTESYLNILEGDVGKQLRTLSLKNVEEVDDRLLDAIKDNCRSLLKLRITGAQNMTDRVFETFFKGWKNRPLVFLDLSKCCHVDAVHPRENKLRAGLCSKGFQALMEHSGHVLKYLNVHGCRHITAQAFEKVFEAGKMYRSLTYLEVSFCEEVTDFIVGCIFRSCPNLKTLNVFGCMKVKDVRVPKGKFLVGVPNAIGMQIAGGDD